MSNPLISVIVPVYNVERLLDRCLDSVVNQSYNNLEIILVDDGSTDNCPTLCDRWRESDHRIRVIHKENGGLSDARNAGIEIAKGDYIGFVDSDDWIAPEMYEKLLQAILENDSDIAACTVQMVWEDGSPEKLLTVHECMNMEREIAQEALLAETSLKQPVWYKLYKKELVAIIPFEKGRYHEDVFWSYQIIGAANRISLIDYIGYYYWQRKGSIMGAGYSLKRLDALDAYCLRYEYMKNNYPKLEDRALTAIWMSCIYHGQMALKYLDYEDKIFVFNKLNTVQHLYPIRRNNYRHLKISHRIWILMSKYSLHGICILKNMLGVGI